MTEHKHVNTEPVHTKEQESNVPGKEAPPPVTEPPQGGLIDTQSGVPQFEPEPYGETRTGTTIEFGGGDATIVDNPSDMAHEYAEIRLNLGSDRYVRLGGIYPVEKKR